MQETVAGILEISDFVELQEEFLCTKGSAVVYVKPEDGDIMVELQNVHPAIDREVKIR